MKLNFKVFGEGEPLIIIHGLFGMLDNWVSFAKKLSSHRMMFVLDLRNHGKSSHSDDFNYELMVEDLLNFMEDNRITKPVLVGHSMGGKLVMHFLKEYENLISKAVIIDIGPNDYPDGHSGIFDAISRLDLSKIESRKDAEIILQKSIPNISIVQFLLKNMGRGKDGYYWKPNFKSLENNYGAIIQGIDFENGISIPVLFVKGGKSHHIRTEDIQSIERYFDLYKIITIPMATHWVHSDSPEELFNSIIEFIE